MVLHSVGNEVNVRNYILWVMRLMLYFLPDLKRLRH